MVLPISSTLILDSANDYGGNTTINKGTIVAKNNTSLGQATKGVVIAANGTLQIDDGVTIAAKNSSTEINGGTVKVDGGDTAVLQTGLTLGNGTISKFDIGANGILTISGASGAITKDGVGDEASKKRVMAH